MDPMWDALNSLIVSVTWEGCSRVLLVQVVRCCMCSLGIRSRRVFLGCFTQLKFEKIGTKFGFVSAMSDWFTY